jgi:holliday junction DNA helicase RuvA
VIGSLRGILLDRAGGEVLVETGAGVGYRVQVTPATSADLGQLGDNVFLYTSLQVREDAQTLFGFADRDARVCFEALLGAHGVGPALALAILSVHSPSQLRRALADDDLAALCMVPGVGKKTAARLLLDLKSRLAGVDFEGSISRLTAVGDGAPVAAGMDGANRSPRVDVRDALTELGYSPDEVRSVMAELPDGGDTSTLLRVALQRLATAGR